MLFPFLIFELSGSFWCQHEAGLHSIPSHVLIKVPLFGSGFSLAHLAGCSGTAAWALWCIPGSTTDPSPLPDTFRWFPNCGANRQSYLCPVLSVQLSLCLTWVSEIINPAKTDVGFGHVTDIFLRTGSGAVKFALSVFVIVLWPGTNPRNFICHEYFTKERSLNQNCITFNLHLFCYCSSITPANFLAKSLASVTERISNPIRIHRLLKKKKILGGQSPSWLKHLCQISLPKFQFNLLIC